jgi:hypothetical protein
MSRTSAKESSKVESELDTAVKNPLPLFSQVSTLPVLMFPLKRIRSILRSLLRSAATHAAGLSILAVANVCLKLKPPAPLLMKMFMAACPQAEPPQIEPGSTPILGAALSRECGDVRSAVAVEIGYG